MIHILLLREILLLVLEDLDIAMSMYNLLEGSKNYSKTAGSLWNYYKDELSDETNDNNGPNKDATKEKQKF